MRKKKEEKFKLKIWKDDLGLKGGYSTWKSAKGDSDKRGYHMKRVRANGLITNSESKCLQEVNIVENDNL